MGLENLKSAFSNITSFNQTDITSFDSKVGDTTPFVKTNITSFSSRLADTITLQNTDVTTMISKYSILTEPQEVDGLPNIHTVGFSANQKQLSPSKFTGVSGITWNNNSLYGIYREPQEVNFFTSLPIIEGFTANFTDRGSGIGNSKFIGVETGTHDVNNIKFSAQQSEGNDYGINNLLHNIPGFTSGFLNRGGDKWGNSKFKDIDSQYQTKFGDPDTYNNASSWIDTNVNLENSSWHFTDNQRRSKPQGSYTYTSHKLGEGDLRFQTLYNAGGTSTDKKYGPKLTIHDSKTGKRWSNPFIAGLFGQDGSEPYITHPIDFTDNDKAYPGISQINPFNRNAFDSLARTTMFLGSTAGILHIVEQNLLGIFQRYRPWYTSLGTIAASVLPAEGLIVPLLTPARDFPADLKGGLGDGRGANYSDYLKWRNEGGGIWDPANANKKIDDAVLNKLNKPLGAIGFETVTSLGKNLKTRAELLLENWKENEADGKKKPALNASNNVNQSLTGNTGFRSLKKLGVLFDRDLAGDMMTLMPVVGTDGEKIDYSENIDLGSPQHGMPFYFKDLRDDSYIIFRAYISGINDTISPSWNTENYIGRSEPVYVYTNAEREIGFNLKLFANTKDELEAIYQKMNRLTSLCYPEYKKLTAVVEKETDEGTTSEKYNINNKVRMKPPLTKFRMGELFGNDSFEMTGFIKSLSYTFPDESPWEIDRGKRVPKYIEASITFQIIHKEAPSLRFVQKNSGVGVDFYGVFNPTSKIGVQ